MQLKYFCFHWQVCFFFGYLCIRFGFFGAPYNGVYKFSAVFFSRCGTGNKSLLLSCQRWRTRPELCSQPAQLKRSRLHISNSLTFSSLIICLVLNGEIPNYIIKFICVRLMLQFFFFNQLLITSNYTFSARIYSCSFFVLLMSLLWAISSATLRGMIVNLFSLGQFMIFFYYFIISLLGSECKNRKRPVNLFLIQMIFWLFPADFLP